MFTSNGLVKQLRQKQVQHQQPVYDFSSDSLQLTGAIKGYSFQPVYEPTTDSTFFAVRDSSSIKRLNAHNEISMGARVLDSNGEQVVFHRITALAADGRGNVFVADAPKGFPSRIRVLKALTGDVVPLRGSEPLGGQWTSLAYDTFADVLVAATHTALCHLPLYGSSASTSGPSSQASEWNTTPQLVAGSWNQMGSNDGIGSSAGFSSIFTVLIGAGWTRYIVEHSRTCSLRVMDASTAVHTLYHVSGMQHGEGAAILPWGVLAVYGYYDTKYGLAIIRGGTGFWPSSPILGAGSTTHQTLLPDLCTLLYNNTAGMVTEAVVEVRAAGGKNYVAHRAVLTAYSEYFRQLLAPNGGFADSGTCVVSLEDVDPASLTCLLGYMYTGRLQVAEPLLRPVLELAGRLLMPASCISQLQLRLLAQVTHGSVVTDLIWAKRHGLTALVGPLKFFLLSRSRGGMATPAGSVRLQELMELASACPDIAAELLEEALVG